MRIYNLHAAAVENSTEVTSSNMRYHPKFQSYPLLKEAVEKRLIDVLYLDTTYAKPKHTFLPQQNAISTFWRTNRCHASKMVQ